MRRGIFTLMVAVGLLFHSTAEAQEGRGSFGFGIGVSSFSLADLEALLMPSLYVPIQAGDQFVVEPFLGLVRMSEGDFSETLLRLGAGLLYLLDVSDDGRVYVGPRIGVIRSSVSNGFSASDTNLTLGGVVGGEYFLSSAFSLGGEGGLRWIDLNTGSVISSFTEFRVRWYMP